MAVCKVCGTENRNKAKFCRGCAAPLPPDAARGGVPPEHICPTCKVRNPAKALFCQACGVPLVPPSMAFHPMPELAGGGTRPRAGVLLVGLALVLAGLGTWWKLSHSNGSASLAATAEATAPVPASTSPNGPATPAPAQAQATPTSAVVADPAATSPAPGDTTHLSEAERLRLSLERLEREDRERTAALEQRRAAMAAEQQRRAELAARRRAEAAAAAAAAAASPAPTPASSPQTSTTTQAAAKTEAAPPAASAATVELACAGSTNFFARDLCRIRECRKPSFARDPICVRFREMEEASRRKLDN